MNRDRFEKVASEWNFNPFVIGMFRRFTEVLRKQISLSKEMKLLDVGGGTGLTAFDLAGEVGNVTIVDSSPAMIETAKKHLTEQGVTNVELVEGDVLSANLATDFDGIYAHMSLHHITDIDGAFERFAKLLEPGGVLVIGDLCSEDGSFHGDEPVPHNGFDTGELAGKLTDAGFGTVQADILDRVDHPRTEANYERFFLTAQK